MAFHDFEVGQTIHWRNKFARLVPGVVVEIKKRSVKVTVLEDGKQKTFWIDPSRLEHRDGE